MAAPLYEFDITLISPGMIEDEDPTSQIPIEELQLSVRAYNCLKRLTQYLQQLNLPSGFSGEIVFEFPVRNGRVVQVVLDEDASTLKESQVIELIKRSLTSWRVPSSATCTVRLTLRIQT